MPRLITSANIIGEIKAYLAASPAAGFLALDGTTIGSTASAATNNSNYYRDLFIFVWNNVSNANAPVSGGRGGSGSADFAANKTLTLPDSRRAVIMGSGGTAVSGPANTPGSTGGAETHVLSNAQISAHKHWSGMGISNVPTEGGLGLSGGSPEYGFRDRSGVVNRVYQGSGDQTPTNYREASTDLATASGTNAAHNNVQPSLVATLMIRY